MSQTDWGRWISSKRFGYQSSSKNSRSEFIRDYDRIIFMSAFRRLQNKTQVFPLPGNVFVHNRLTHSLEVASVGRSLGVIVGHSIVEKYKDALSSESIDFFKHELSGVISSACLAHDVGNPAFGHSGEKAISHFFRSNAEYSLDGRTLRSFFVDHEWKDITNFEGNANAFRLLTRQFRGKLSGGQNLMMVTLAAILKYPCSSMEMDEKVPHKKKFGYFLSDKEAFDQVITSFVMGPDGYICRHPFVYLVEAADDICYRIIDLEDAHRIHLLSYEVVSNLFLDVIKETSSDYDRTYEVIQKIDDHNEGISFLRAKCIGLLIQKATEVFMANAEAINQGSYRSTLVDDVEISCPALNRINAISIKKIYNHTSVIEVELAGYNVMSELLQVFAFAMLAHKPTALQKKSLQLIPDQYNYVDLDVSPYEKIMGVLDYVSGMTDGYATELYRKVKGIDIPSHIG
jgi:dGTPase